MMANDVFYIPLNNYIPAMAASSASPICLACGELAAKKDRRLLDISGRVTIYWKEIISQELEKTQPQIDVDELLCPGPSFMCRKCFYVKWLISAIYILGKQDRN